jgi:hypothetical protein
MAAHVSTGSTVTIAHAEMDSPVQIANSKSANVIRRHAIMEERASSTATITSAIVRMDTKENSAKIMSIGVRKVHVKMAPLAYN